MFFTIIAIALISLFLISYTSYEIVKDRSAISKRIKTMDNFVFSVEQDLPRMMYISGYRIIFLFEKRLTETGNYITDFNSTFEEAFLNGSMYNEQQELMAGATFSDIEDSLRDKASKTNAEAILSYRELQVTQDDPWRVKLTLVADLSIKDNSNLSSWNKTANIVAYIPIENFEDPLYIVNTRGKVTNKINKTIYEPFVEGNNVSNLLLHLESSYYLASDSAPDFLSRLEGRTLPDENGIESFVNLPELSFQGISVKDKSCVDYIYFSSDNPESYNIQGMPSWFKIDGAHLDKYGVGGLIA